MKKYLISGFNTVQDVKLEVGTYTLVAYAKSMYSNVYTFALGDGINWTEYDIDVVKGQLCKVWLTFTIDKKATKFKPIANNFSESLPVYVADLQLTRGNIPVEAGASPFDIDQILNDLHDEIDAIEDFTEGAFKDGLLNDVEKMQLRASLDSIGSIVESVKGSYNKLKDNPFIHEDIMTSITTRYNAFMNAWESTSDPRGLKPVILWIIKDDNIVDENERDEKDRALNAFNLALYEYNQAEKEVYNDVGEPPKISDGYPKTQYAIGNSKTIYPTIGWGDAIIDVTESKPYLWSRQEIKYDSGDTLYTGYLMLTNITPATYMAGEWDLSVAYTRNDKSYPIVTYKKGTNNRPLYYYPKKEGVIGYEYFVTPPTAPSSGWYKKGDIVWYEDTDEEHPLILGLYKANINTRFNPHSSDWDNVTADYAPNGVEGQKLWEFADGMELIITEALMANFAKLDSFVFNKGKMFSQEGNMDDYTDEGFIPNFEVDGVSGRVKMKDAEIEGRVIATSGNLDSVTVTNADIKDATIDGLLKVSSGYEGKIGDYNLFWIAPMSAKILTVPTTYDSKGKSIKFYNASSTVSHTLNLLVIGYKLNSNGEIVLTNYTLSDEAKGARKDSVFIPPRGSVEVSCFEIPPGNYKSTGGDSDVYDRVLSWEMTNRDYYNSPE